MKSRRPAVVAVISLAVWIANAYPTCSGGEDPPKSQSGPWKWDVSIYDKPGWFTPWMAPPRLLGDEIILRCTSHPENVYADDFYAEKSETVTLSSMNGGRSWRKTAAERYDQATPNALSDRRKAYLDTRPSFSRELDTERREKLKKAGLAQLSDTGWAGWTIFAESMSSKLKEMGYDVFDQHPAIPAGQVAVYSVKLFGKWSSDGGETWQDSAVELPTFGHGPVHNSSLRLPNGMLLWFYYGAKLHEKSRCNYVVRSTDCGHTWKTVRIASDPSWHLSEASPLLLPSGRILLMIRCDAGAGVGHVHVTWSDDNGQTWQPVQRAPIRGYPLGAICLKSGAVLCTYGYRWFPGGIRACLSHDQGATWDIKQEKILRDDVIPTCWIAPTGAHSVQMKDGTIFTAFVLQKAVDLKQGDTAGGNIFRVTGVTNGRFHCYVAGCRYSEDYVRPFFVESECRGAGVQNCKPP
jgi:hypothetical protein